MDDRAREMDRAMKIAIDAEIAYLASKDHPSKYRPNETAALAAAISAYGDEREREALERAAKVAEDHHNSHPDAICGITIATIIRSLIKTAPEGERSE